MKNVVRLILVSITTQCSATLVGLFRDADTFIQQSTDIVVARCSRLPGPNLSVDGPYPVEIDILQVWKGGRQTGKRKIATIYPMEVGSLYVVTGSGGLAYDTDFIATAQLTVIPLRSGTDLKALQVGSVRERVLRVLHLRQAEVKRQLLELKREEELLDRAVAASEIGPTRR